MASGAKNYCSVRDIQNGHEKFCLSEISKWSIQRLSKKKIMLKASYQYCLNVMTMEKKSVILRASFNLLVRKTLKVLSMYV